MVKQNRRATPRLRTRPAKPAGEGAMEDRHFACAVCSKKQLTRNRNGSAGYVTAPNGGRICLGCQHSQELADMEKGRLTVMAQIDGNNKAGSRWIGVTPSGRVKVNLLCQGTETIAQTIANPRFQDKDGNLWNGRLYKTGMIVFQRTQGAAGGLNKDKSAPRTRSRRKAAAI